MMAHDRGIETKGFTKKGEVRNNPARKLIVGGCNGNCSLNPRNLPVGVGELVHGWYEEGVTPNRVYKRLIEMDIKVSQGATYRHYHNHLHESDETPDPEGLTDLEVIETFIARGTKQLKQDSTKITGEQLLRAIELKLKLTQGSVFDSMFEAMKGNAGGGRVAIEDEEIEEEEEKGPELPKFMMALEDKDDDEGG